MAPISLTFIEIIVLQIGAVILGMAIYFFISSKKSLHVSSPENVEKLKEQIKLWKQKYLNEINIHEKELLKSKGELYAAEDLHKKCLNEMEDLNWKITDLENRIEDAKENDSPLEKPAYLKQLNDAGMELRNQTEKINNMLSQVDFIKETEENTERIATENESLKAQITTLRYQLSQKETELIQKKEKEEIYTEMNSMLDNANDEFKTLREKIQKLEAQLIHSQMDKLDLENLNESFQRLSKEYRDLKDQSKKDTEKINRISGELDETIIKLRESNFERQQLLKKVNYMEELKNDLRIMSDSNKSLDSHLNRISELESMLNILSQERNEMKNQNPDN